MASLPIPSLFKLTLLLQLLFIPTHSSSCGYTSIYSFGDSLADTGNRAFAPDHTPSFCINHPYGITYFKKPTGRCSDGRLMLDFIAEGLGLPLLPPYLRGLSAPNANYPQGVNFAVAGATAINNTYFERKGIQTWTNNSLGVQIEWFRSMLPLICATGNNCDTLSKSLFIVGEIGGNDFNYPLLNGGTLEEARVLIPMIISTISSAIQELINLGARNFMVPGNFPIGCNAAYLMYFSTPDIDAYEPSTGCIKWLNQFVQTFNRQLEDELQRLRQRYMHVNIMYADYYKAAMRIYRAPSQFGFTNSLEACCGGYAPTGDSSSLSCGHPGAKACSDPSKYVSWDGVHLTESAYKAIATGLLKGTFAYPATDGLCPTIARDNDHVMTQ